MSIDLSKDHGASYLRHVRTKTLDMTQEQFADLMGVSVATLRNWEQGQTPVPRYFEMALKVFEADPGTAMSAVGAARSYDGPQDRDWDFVTAGPGQHARRMAVEEIKSDPRTALMMDLAQGLRRFGDLSRTLGYDLDRKELLGLAILSELHAASWKDAQA